MRKILSPDRVYSVATSVRESDRHFKKHEIKARELFEKHRRSINSVFNIPLFAAPVVERAMKRMIKVDPTIRFSAIITRNGNVLLSASSKPAYSEELDLIKLDMYNEIDYTLVERAKEFIK